MQWEPRVDQLINPNTSELLKEAKEANKVDRERGETYESLLKHPGWALYIGQLDARIQQLADEVLKPAGSVDRAIALEHQKGAMCGLIIARDLPSVTIAAMTQLPAEE